MADGRSQDGGQLDEFERLLDAYGADVFRWPASRRSNARALLQQQNDAGQQARRMMREAAALDRVLAAPPPIDLTRMASLQERILDAAGAGGAKVNVVPLPRPKVAADRLRRSSQAGWAAITVLAASLFVGAIIGPGSTGLPALRDAVDAFGLSSYVDQLALAPTDDDVAGDEDVL